MFLEAHAHIKGKNAEKFSFLEAEKLQIKRVFLNAQNEEELECLLSLYQEFPEMIVPFFGFHPFDVEKIKQADFFFLEDALKTYDFLQIGEIGLDKTKPFFDKQEEIFKKQLALSLKYQRAVSLHCVKAFSTLIPLLKTIKTAHAPFLFHAFSGGIMEAKALQNRSAYFSFSKKAKALSFVPKERILLETDSPSRYASFTEIVKVYEEVGLDSSLLQNNAKAFLTFRKK